MLPRDQRETCDAPSYDPDNPSHHNARRVDLAAMRTMNNMTLVRRVMDLPTPGNMDDFIMRETSLDGDSIAIVWQLHEFDKVKKERVPYDVNTSLYYDFSQARSLSAIRLKGCTMMAVISRRGVFIGHWWENLSFSIDDDLLEKWAPKTPEQIFQINVLDGIKNGVTELGKPSQMSLTKFAQELGDEHVRAFLIRPNQNKDRNSNGKDGYPEQWQRMRDEVVRILPKINEDGRWQTVIYDVVPQARFLNTSPRGRLLFKIDPEHVPAATRRGKATRLAVLWLEDREIFRDQWQD